MNLIAESYVHTIDPFAIQLTDTFGLRWYGLAYMAGFVIAWIVMRKMASTGRFMLTRSMVGDLMTWSIVGVLVGGRLGHVLFYEPSLLWKFTSEIPFWGVLEIHRGGMASHGGILGVIIACTIFAIRRSIPPMHVLDIVAFVAPPGLGLGRMANLVNAEHRGEPLPESMQANPPWWSVKYPDEVLDPAYADPSRLEPLRMMVDPSMEFPQSLYVAAYSGRQDVVDALSPMLTAHYPSQVFQFISDGIILWAVLAIAWLKPRRAGVISAWFLMAYGVLRILTEQYRGRIDDVFMIGPVEMPELLSILMILVGMLLLLIFTRAKGPLYGGLLEGGPVNPRPDGSTGR